MPSAILTAIGPEETWTGDSLLGQVLIAMPPPAMENTAFERSVIYMCAHSESGAMGLILNKPSPDLTFHSVLESLNIDPPEGPESALRIHIGGPVDTKRGFVLHSLDYCVNSATQEISEEIGMTATVDVLRALADGSGPDQALFALGYAGWGPGQLEDEIKNNGWLHGPADSSLVFDTPCDQKWARALGVLGVGPSILSSVQGTA